MNKKSKMLAALNSVLIRKILVFGSVRFYSCSVRFVVRFELFGQFGSFGLGSSVGFQ